MKQSTKDKLSLTKMGSKNPRYKQGLEKYRTKEWLTKMYIDQELSLSEIGKLAGVSTVCIFKWMKKASVPRRGAHGRSGIHSPRFKGFTINSQGYRLVPCHRHPHKDSRGYMREHIIVVEQHLNRILDPQETVHHINDDKLDNRIENLYLFSTSNEHSRYHFQKYWNSEGFIPIKQSNLVKNG